MYNKNIEIHLGRQTGKIKGAWNELLTKRLMHCTLTLRHDRLTGELTL